MKVGIVVPYSWSFGGGVVDHADAQRRALEAAGIETRLLIGHDPPGSFSRILHPRQGRPGPPPPGRDSSYASDLNSTKMFRLIPLPSSNYSSCIHLESNNEDFNADCLKVA